MILRALVLSIFLAASARAEPPLTLRVDFYHTGNADTEMISIDRLVLESLSFSGNLRHRVDTTLRGKYLFEIRDPESGSVAWSRSFSSIYGEWETTAEAREMNRTFHESLRFPNQAKPFDLVLKKRANDNSFEEFWRIRLDPEDYLIHREAAAYSDQIVAIERNGNPEDKVDLLLLGDGYKAEEQQAFLKKARALTETLFSTPPFSLRRKDFNVWALAPAAVDSGVSRPSTGIYRDSPIGATYDAFRSERYVLTMDNRKWRKIASSAPYDFVEILTNSDTYGGGGIYGLFSTAAANSKSADYLFVHEFAHHFAGLADEYYTSSVAYEAPAEITEPYEPNVTALLDPEHLKWRHLLDEHTPLPTPWPKQAYEEHSLGYQTRRTALREENAPEAAMDQLFRDNQNIVEGLFSAAPHRDDVGAFEGAIYQASGYYRSEQNCIMFTRTTDFCRVCAAAIEEVIDEFTQ